MAKDTDKRGDGKSGNRREPPIIDLTAKSVRTGDAKPGEATAKPAESAPAAAAKPGDTKPASTETATPGAAAMPVEAGIKSTEAAASDAAKPASVDAPVVKVETAPSASEPSAVKPAVASPAADSPNAAEPDSAAATATVAGTVKPEAGAAKPSAEAQKAPGPAAEAAKGIDRAEVDRAAARAAERERQQDERRQQRDREPRREGQSAALPLVAGIAGGFLGLAVAYGLAATGNWPSPFDPADAQRIQAPLRTEIEAQKTRAADLERRIAAASPAGVEQIQARVAAAEQQLATATRTLQDLAAAPKADPEGMKRLETLSTERKAQVEALRTEVDTLRKELVDSQQSFAKAASDRMAALDTRAKAIEDHFLAELATTRGRLAEQLDAAKGELSGATQKAAADAKAALDKLAAGTKASTDKLAADLAAARTDAAGAAAALTARLDQDAKALDEKLAAARGALGEEVARHDETKKSLDRVVGQLNGYDDLRKTVDVLFSRVAGIDELRRGLDDAKGRLAAVDAAKAATEQNRTALAETRGRLDQVAAKAGEVDGVAKALGDTTAKTATLGDQMKGLETRLAEVDQTARKGLETRSEALLALTLGGLKTAIDEGRPYATELATARALGKGVVDLAPLDAAAAKGIPTPAQLGTEFTRLAPDILDATRPPSGDNVLDRLVSSAVSSVSVRRVGDAPGNSAEAIVARIEAKLAARDLAGALTEWNMLPEAGRAKSSEWAEKLKSRVAADKALGAVTASAIGKLVQPGQ